MSSKSMEGHFSLFYNERCKDIEERMDIKWHY